ncbi:MAG: hypothetical protein JO049_19640 [Hyphomicrobiales bacterium]|nr:hypothetical protein [Hyphomicrobiales bacterium]
MVGRFSGTFGLGRRRARRTAAADLAALYRERDIQRARAKERDPALPLQ